MARQVVAVCAVVAGAAFFLPLVQAEIFGFGGMATGLDIGGRAWAIPIAAGVILLGCLLYDSPETRVLGTRVIQAGTWLGIAITLIAAYELVRDRAFGISAWDAGVRPAFGALVVAAGFAVAFTAGSGLRESIPSLAAEDQRGA
jgi:hypothetical protein